MDNIKCVGILTSGGDAPGMKHRHAYDAPNVGHDKHGI